METITEISRKDFLEFNKYVLIKTRIKRHVIIALFFVLLWVVTLNLNSPFDWVVILIEIVVFSLAWAGLIFLLYQLNLYRIKKIPDKNGAILGNKKYIILEEGFREITDTSDTTIKWPGIKKIVETDGYFYVFVDKMAAFIIPKRSFVDVNEQSQFFQQIESRIDSE